MTYTTQFENVTLELVTAIVMAPVQIAYGLVWLLYQCVKGIAATGKAGVYAAGIGATLGACLACPCLAIGLALIVAFAWVTMPRKAVR